uniref:BAG family molecular chaperone regulator 1 isoform X4 n=1 Tax=Lonchura striata TaxID=40157 RepID=UPI000B4D774E|nr:BAG family molecular chaperone regulator 1 isoform X4 [Lonchura striata domestica]
MAAPGAPVTVTITYSNEKHSIQVASQREDGEPTLQDMAVLIEQVTGVPVPFQKLIYKGKSLKELEQPLSALGVKNGCKVMLIGKRGFLAKDLQAEALKQLDKRIKGTAEQFMKTLEQIDAINLPENFSDCKLKKKGLVKRVQVSFLGLYLVCFLPFFFFFFHKCWALVYQEFVKMSCLDVFQCFFIGVLYDLPLRGI